MKEESLEFKLILKVADSASCDQTDRLLAQATEYLACIIEESHLKHSLLLGTFALAPAACPSYSRRAVNALLTGGLQRLSKAAQRSGRPRSLHDHIRETLIENIFLWSDVMMSAHDDVASHKYLQLAQHKDLVNEIAERSRK